MWTLLLAFFNSVYWKRMFKDVVYEMYLFFCFILIKDKETQLVRSGKQHWLSISQKPLQRQTISIWDVERWSQWEYGGNLSFMHSQTCIAVFSFPLMVAWVVVRTVKSELCVAVCKCVTYSVYYNNQRFRVFTKRMSVKGNVPWVD